MGEVRKQEMQQVQKTLGISEMKILDYPDGRLARQHPLELEAEMAHWIGQFKPDVVVTYPVHGGSGHHDHITLHHVIKRLFYEKPAALHHWRRLAYFTVIDTGKPSFFEGGIPRVTWTKPEDVQVTVELSEANVQQMKQALLCYETYQEMVKTTHVVERIGNQTYFELENEYHSQMLRSITEAL